MSLLSYLYVPLYVVAFLFTGMINSQPCDNTLLQNTSYIAVPWNTGGCYYFNTETHENTDYFPGLCDQ